MKFAAVSFSAALGAVVAFASPAAALTVDFDFRSTPETTSFGTDLTFTESGISVDVSGATGLVSGDSRLGFYTNGLGVGAGNSGAEMVSPGRGRVGLGETLVLSFGQEVSMTALALVEFSKGNTQEFQIFVDGNVVADTFGVNGPNGSVQTLTFDTPLVGSLFEILGATPDVTEGPDAGRQGVFVAGTTVDVEMAAVPVGPAAPLLGSALLLLALRARRKAS